MGRRNKVETKEDAARLEKKIADLPAAHPESKRARSTLARIAKQPPLKKPWEVGGCEFIKNIYQLPEPKEDTDFVTDVFCGKVMRDLTKLLTIEEINAMCALEGVPLPSGTRIQKSGRLKYVHKKVIEMTDGEKYALIKLMGLGFGKVLKPPPPDGFSEDDARVAKETLCDFMGKKENDVEKWNVGVTVYYTHMVNGKKMQEIAGGAIFCPVDLRKKPATGKLFQRAHSVNECKVFMLNQFTIVGGFSGQGLGKVVLETMENILKIVYGVDLYIFNGCAEHFYRITCGMLTSPYGIECPFVLNNANVYHPDNLNVFFYKALTTKYRDNIVNEAWIKKHPGNIYFVDFNSEVLDGYYMREESLKYKPKLGKLRLLSGETTIPSSSAPTLAVSNKEVATNEEGHKLPVVTAIPSSCASALAVTSTEEDDSDHKIALPSSATNEEGLKIPVVLSSSAKIPAVPSSSASTPVVTSNEEDDGDRKIAPSFSATNEEGHTVPVVLSSSTAKGGGHRAPVVPSSSATMDSAGDREIAANLFPSTGGNNPGSGFGHLKPPSVPEEVVIESKLVSEDDEGSEVINDGNRGFKKDDQVQIPVNQDIPGGGKDTAIYLGSKNGKAEVHWITQKEKDAFLIDFNLIRKFPVGRAGRSTRR